MGEVRYFDVEKAEREGDASTASPLNVLKELIREIESGEIPPPDKVYIAMRTPDDDEAMFRYNYRSAGLNRLEAIGLLTKHIGDL